MHSCGLGGRGKVSAVRGLTAGADVSMVGPGRGGGGGRGLPHSASPLPGEEQVMPPGGPKAAYWASESQCSS